MAKNHRSGYVQRLFFLVLMQRIRTRHIGKWFKVIPGKKKRLWEDFRHGLFLGSEQFIERIKSRYLSEKPDVEIPQKRQVLRDTDPETILKKAARALKCNISDFLPSARISNSHKLNRDMLIYLLWSTGWYTNKEIGELFGLGYSSISRRVAVMKSKISQEDTINNQLENIKSLIKV